MENKKKSAKKKTSSSAKKTSTTTKKVASTTSSKKTASSVSSKKASTAKVSSTPKSTVDLKKIREEEKPKVDLIKVEPTEKVISKDVRKYLNIAYAVGALIVLIGILFNGYFAETEFSGVILGDYDIPVKLIGLLILTGAGIFHSVQSEKNSLIKSLLVVLGMGIFGTWLFPTGSLNGAEFIESVGYGISVNELVSLAYYGVYMCIDKLVFLILIGLFYKVANATGSYKKIISSIADKFKNNKNNVAIATAIIVIVLTSFVKETYAVLFLLPFFISILAYLKVDKFTAFAVTFGALIAGTIGSPYGTESLIGFNYYSSLAIENGLMYRFAIQLCVIVLFVVFVLLRSKTTVNEDAVEEQFLTACENDNNKLSNAKPLIAFMIIAGLIFTVGFIDWNTNFGIEIFTNFTEWLYTAEVFLTEEGISIFTMILGEQSYASVIGAFSVFDGITVLLILIPLMALSYRMSFQKVIDELVSTVKFLAKPLLVIVLITSIFTIGYMTEFTVGLSSFILNLTPEFNPFTSSIVAAINGLFSNDLAFTAYSLSAYFSERFTDVTDIFGVCYTSISALIQLIIPTSPLLIGLYYTKVPYKSWIKYIALFFAGMLIVILMLLTVVTYLA